jgi:hypothetical protein
MAFSSLNTVASSSGLGVASKPTTGTTYSSGLTYKTYSGNSYSNNSTYFFGANTVNSVISYYYRGITAFSDSNTGKASVTDGTTTNIVTTSILTFTNNNTGKNGTESCIVTFYGYFKPNASGTWYFKMGSSTYSNDDICCLWFGSEGQTISSLKSSATNSNYNKAVTYTTWQNSSGFSETSEAYSVYLNVDKYYPIMMNWGQGSGGQVLELSFRISTDSYSTNGSGYYFNDGT